MTPENITKLKSSLPYLFDIKEVNLDWDEDFHVIDKYDNYPNPFDESGSFPDGPISEINEDLTVEQINDSIQVRPDDEAITKIEDEDLTKESVEKLKEIFGTDFPGSPGGSNPVTRGKVATIDTLGFYLPWHKFDINTWGIYIFAEGIITLGNQLHLFSKGFLPQKDCNLVARAFIYHHEAYHNKIEAFSSKLEVISRKPVFINTTANLLYKSNTRYHEEALANAYAFKKCCDLFERYPHNQKVILRAVTRRALAKFISNSPPKYIDAKDLIPIDWKRTFRASENIFDQEEGIFSEKILQDRLNLNTPNQADLWSTQGHLMDPTLKRNAPYSYLINKKSKLAKRLKLSVHYLNRRTFVTALKNHYPDGKLIIRKGSRSIHPEKFILGQKQIPVPSRGKKEINKYTAEAILKQLGNESKISDFIKSNQ